MIKFFYYWLRQGNALKVTEDNMKLIDQQEVLIDKLFVDTGITHESVNYENDAKMYTFVQLSGFDKQKAYAEYLKTLPLLPPEITSRETIFGQEALTEQVTKHYPNYKLSKFDMAIVMPNYTLNTQLFCQKLNEYLLSKVQNVKIMYNTEVEQFIFDEQN